MPRTGVSCDDVADAIHHLEKAGLTPSIRMIREKLGRGSLTTIAEHKRTVDAERAGGPGEALPDPITRALVAGAQRHWQELVDAAQSEIDAVKETVQAERQALENQLAEATRENARLNDDVGAKTAAMSDLEADKRELTARLETQAEAARENDLEVAKLNRDNAALNARIVELKDEREQARDALAQSQAESARLTERLEGQAAELARDRATWQAQAQSDRAELVALADQVRQADTARQAAEKTVTELRQRTEDAERERARLEKALAASEAQGRSLVEELGELRGRLVAAEDRLAGDRQNFERVLAENTARAATLESALEQAQRLVRQYATSTSEDENARATDAKKKSTRKKP